MVKFSDVAKGNFHLPKWETLAAFVALCFGCYMYYEGGKTMNTIQKNDGKWLIVISGLTGARGLDRKKEHKELDEKLGGR